MTVNPLSGSVKVVGSNGGIVTDVNGRFSLTLPQGHNKVTISYVGMAPQTITG